MTISELAIPLLQPSWDPSSPWVSSGLPGIPRVTSLYFSHCTHLAMSQLAACGYTYFPRWTTLPGRNRVLFAMSEAHHRAQHRWNVYNKWTKGARWNRARTTRHAHRAPEAQSRSPGRYRGRAQHQKRLRSSRKSLSIFGKREIKPKRKTGT